MIRQQRLQRAIKRREIRKRRREFMRQEQDYIDVDLMDSEGGSTNRRMTKNTYESPDHTCIR